MRTTTRLSGAIVLALVAGCASAPQSPPLDPLPLRQAVAIVNQNAAGIHGTLRASGSVDGHFTDPQGRRFTYHVNGVMFYLAPDYFRFDLKKFGERQLLLGSNDQMYWMYTRQDDSYHCGRHSDPLDADADLPINPRQVLAALGLSGVEWSESSDPASRLVQRIVDDAQQVLLVVHDQESNSRIEREYWLDRRHPRLIRRIVFRDAIGSVEMESRLDRFEKVSANGPLLPRFMSARWPQGDAEMRFEIGRWEILPSLGGDGPQFATPAECAQENNR